MDSLKKWHRENRASRHDDLFQKAISSAFGAMQASLLLDIPSKYEHKLKDTSQDFIECILIGAHASRWMDASTGALINVTDGINAVHNARSKKVVSADLAKTEHAAALAEVRAAMATNPELIEEWFELAKTIIDQAMIAQSTLDQEERDELHAHAPWLNDFATKAKAAALDKSSKAKVNDRMFQPACNRIAETCTVSGSLTKCNNDTRAGSIVASSPKSFLIPP